jgi:lysophospholipase L1-like esterase
MFPAGTTEVACTVRDAQQRTESCGFNVTVVVPPRISVTKFLAFGDSITFGSTALCNRLAPGLLTWEMDVQSLLANVVVPDSYPFVLEGLLKSRYTGQAPTVTNEGVPGERVTAAATEDRLRSALGQHGPEVLLLQEGVNDLHRDRTPDEVADGLRELVRIAHARGVTVFVGTLVPEVRKPGACRAFQPDLIAPTNSLIRSMVRSEGAELVDLYAAFGGEGSPFIGEDGLHPSPAGYAKIAETFFEALRGRLEVVR